MRKFYIFYPLFSVILLSTIYFFTLMQGSLQRSAVLFPELAAKAYELKDMTPFIKYQSVAYNLLDSSISGDYQLESYQVIVYDNGVYKNSFVIYVLPLTTVDFAQTVTDENDETGIILIDNETSNIILDTYTFEAYEEKALSVGILDYQFYYHHTYIEADTTLDLSIYDYHGDLIFSKIIEYDFVEYSPDSGQMELGYTKDELEELLDINGFVKPLLIRNITVFLAIDIFLGGLIIFVAKKKKP